MQQKIRYDNGDAWYKDWLGENTTTKLTHKITAQSDTLEIFFQVGQDEYADVRENNHIVFESFSLVKKEAGAANTVSLDGYDFTHGESGDVAKGSLYNDNDGNMVYYAEKLGSVDCHNEIIGINMIVEPGAGYTLTVEVEAEKGLDMVTAIPNEADDQDTCFEDWLEPETSTTLSYNFTAPNDTMEVFFRVGQEEDPEDREDNHIVFKSISLEENEEELEVATSSNAKGKKEQGGTEKKQGGTGSTGPNLNKGTDAAAPVEKGPEESENKGAEAGDTTPGGAETEQGQEETGAGRLEPDFNENENAEGGETEQGQEETETDSSASDSDETGDTGGKDSEESENSSGETEQKQEETGMDSAAVPGDGKKEEEAAAL